MQTRPIYWAALDSKDVERLPPRVKEPPGEYAGDEWILVRAPAGPMRSLIDKLNRLHDMFPRGLVDSSRERHLDRALELLLAAESGPEGDLVAENLQMRRDYAKETPMLTAAQIHKMSGLRSRNTSVPASRWKAEGKIFALRIGGRDHYPAFQFENGAPRSIVKNILALMPPQMTPWQIAFWFASNNGWLNGDKPRECLDNPAAVVDAARQMADIAIG